MLVLSTQLESRFCRRLWQMVGSNRRARARVTSWGYTVLDPGWDLPADDVWEDVVLEPVLEEASHRRVA